MPDESRPYQSWTAIAAAVKAAAVDRHRTEGGGSLTVGDHIKMATIDRFLSRVFAEGDQSEWLLKGGTAMLARVPRTRRTRDVDLAATGGAELDEAVAELERLAQADLGDHIRFTLIRQDDTGRGDTQPGVRTRKAVWACWAGHRKIDEIQVDLVVGPAPVGRVEIREPASRLPLARPLRAYPYRLFPIADQVAEKVSATMSTAYPGGRSSSRVKDLVDLVVIARTQRVDLRELQLAIASKRASSRLAPFERLRPPDGWGPTYRAMAKTVPAAAEHADIESATELMDEFLTPALAAEPAPEGMVWLPGRGWLPEDKAELEQHEAEQPSETVDGGAVWVQPHVRAGSPVAGHWRSPRT